MVELLDIILWFAQEAGVLLAVGAALAVMAGYAFTMRDGTVSEKEARYSKNSHRAIDAGLALMILSGLIITFLHVSFGQSEIVFEPIFLFKWLLIAGLTLAYILERKKPYGSALAEGVIGGAWVALFLVHTLAPLVGWGILIGLFAVEMGVFVGAWMLLMRAITKPSPLEQQKKAVVEPAQPKVQPVPPPMSKIAPPPVMFKPTPQLAPVQPVAQPAALKLPVPPPPPVAASPKPAAPTPAPTAPVMPPKSAQPASAPAMQKQDDVHHSPFLPAVHFMPANQQQIEDKSHIIPLGKFTRTT